MISIVMLIQINVPVLGISFDIEGKHLPPKVLSHLRRGVFSAMSMQDIMICGV